MSIRENRSRVFLARGSFYVSAGNPYRSVFADLPGFIPVNGSDGVIGEATRRTASTEYNNGGTTAINNATLIPKLLADGSVDVNGDGKADFPADERAPHRFANQTANALRVASHAEVQQVLETKRDPARRGDEAKLGLLQIPRTVEPRAEQLLSLYNEKIGNRLVRLRDAVDLIAVLHWGATPHHRHLVRGANGTHAATGAYQETLSYKRAARLLAVTGLGAGT